MAVKEIMAASFRELARERPVDKIAVKEITANCDYSQTTFYRQFKDKYDLIAWSYSRDLEAIMRPLADGTRTFRQILLDAAAYYWDHRDYLANLFQHTSGYDSFVGNMTDIHCCCLRDAILKIAEQNSLDNLTLLYIRLYCVGTVQISCEWILGRHPISVAQLAEVYENALPRPLRPYFLEK